MTSSDTIEYHFVITLNGNTGPDENQVTVGARGVVDLDPATDTRATVCDRLVQQLQNGMLEHTGALLNDTNVVFFSLEPNQL